MTTATYLLTESLPVADLTPYPGNAKVGDVPTILESLCRNGQYRSLIVRQTEGARVVLAGNHTLQAIAAHGPGDCGLTVRVGEEGRPCGLCGNAPWEPVARCEVVECDDSTARRINLVDNKSAERGDWDEAALADLLDALEDDYAGTGYTDTDLTDLVAAVEEALLDDEDKDEEPTPAPARAAPPAAQDAPAAAPAPVPAGTDGTDGTGLSTLIPLFIEPGAPPAPAPAGHIEVRLTYPHDDRDEVTRLIAAARVGSLMQATAPEIVLRGLRALVAVLDSRHSPDQVVTVAELLRAAGVHAE